MVCPPGRLRRQLFLCGPTLKHGGWQCAQKCIEALGDLIPYCSACALNIVIPADIVAMNKVSAGLNELQAGKRWRTQSDTAAGITPQSTPPKWIMSKAVSLSGYLLGSMGFQADVRALSNK